MAGGHFGDHLAVVRGGPEKLRFEWNYGERGAFQRFSEVCRREVRPLRHANMIETVMRAVVVWPRGAQQIDQVLGIPQVGKVRAADHKDLVSAYENPFAPGRPLMRNIQNDARNGAAQ